MNPWVAVGLRNMQCSEQGWSYSRNIQSADDKHNYAIAQLLNNHNFLFTTPAAETAML